MKAIGCAVVLIGMFPFAALSGDVLDNRLEFPEYGISRRCNHEGGIGISSSLIRCGDREEAFQWLLRSVWFRQVQERPESVAICRGAEESFSEAPSYQRLAICLMDDGGMRE